MRLLVQMGNVRNSVIDHLIQPLARVPRVERIMVVTRRRGPDIPGVEYHTPPAIFVNLPAIAVLCEMWILLRLAKSAKPDYIIGHLIFPHAMMAAFASMVSGHRFVASFIAGPVECYSLLGSPLGVDLRKEVPLVGRTLLRVLRESSAVITTGMFTKEFLKRNGIPAEKIHPIIHTPTPSQFHPTASEKSYDVLSVGRLAPVKHFETLIYAIAMLKETKPDINACIVGDGPCMDELQRLANRLNVTDEIHFVGFRENVVDYYNMSRVFVLTSEREGFPNVLLEAMMCGIPSVVSRCGDVLDLAINEETSLVVPEYSDYQGFAKAIARLLDDNGLRNRLSDNARAMLNTYSIDEATRRWSSILE